MDDVLKSALSVRDALTLIQEVRDCANGWIQVDKIHKQHERYIVSNSLCT